MENDEVVDRAEWLVSDARFAGYLRAAEYERSVAVELYQCDVALGAACFEAFHHVEIVVRIAMDRQLALHVPSTVRRWDQLEWSEAEATRPERGDSEDRRLAEIMRAGLRQREQPGRRQVFDLTRPGHLDHRALSGAVPHLARGRGSAFVQRQRYTSSAQLMRAESTTDL
ncbi:hypothetical protein WHI96_06490 [Pseudonocardia tropica]|uniref:Uncharacterized protein n=1 Tax=Pseudonocardia tropica TaxID=681289 RepID=A0ABV1JR88_9PSEU